MAKVDLIITGKDKGASAAVKGVTKSMITASLAVEGIKLATKALINVGKQAITLFAEQEKQEKQLENVIKSTGMAAGVTAQEMKDLASSLQQVTTFGDEAILRGQNMLLTFTKIGGEIMPQATEAILNMSQAMGTDLQQQAIQVGKALNDPIQGIAALRRVGVQLTDEQTDLVKSFMEVGDIASAQKVILGELETQFGGSARAARDTFGGALAALKNVQGDTLEGFGKIASILGKDIVESMIKGQQAIKDFISDSDKIGKLAGSFEVMKTIVVDLGSGIINSVKNAFEPLADAFRELFANSDNTGNALMMLGTIFQQVSSGVKIASTLVRFFLQSLIDIIKVIKEVSDVMTAFYEALANPTKWGEVKDSIDNVGEAFKNLGTNALSNVKDIVDTTIDEFANFSNNAKTNAEKYATVWKEANEKVRKEFSTLGADLEEEEDDKLKKLNKKTEDGLEENKDIWKKYVDSLSGFMNELSTLLVDQMNATYDSMTANIQENLEMQLESIDEAAQREMEIQGIAIASKQESLQQEIDDLNSAISQEQDAETKADLEAQLQEKKDALARQKILDNAEKKKEKILKKATEKETAVKKKQFEDNKAFSIANIWINAASAVIGWWAAFAGMGIPGIVLAGVMTAATLAMAGVQTGLVASQTFHGQEGGVVPVGTASGDRAVTFMNKGEALFKSDDYQALVGMARGESGISGGFINQGNITIVANDPEEFHARLIEIERFEGVR